MEGRREHENCEGPRRKYAFQGILTSNGLPPEMTTNSVKIPGGRGDIKCNSSAMFMSVPRHEIPTRETGKQTGGGFLEYVAKAQAGTKGTLHAAISGLRRRLNGALLRTGEEGGPGREGGAGRPCSRTSQSLTCRLEPKKGRLNF